MRRLRRRRRLSAHDRVGLGWRPELAAGILANLHAIDVVEVLADDYADAGRAALRSLRTLARQVPVLVHAVGLGLASCSPVDERRLAGIARVVHGVEPELWSEHLAFVRAGGREIGHLTAPSRTRATVEGAAVNLARAQRVVGALPHVENVATLVDPPGSDMDEPAWICAVLAATGSRLLLDLHNLHANAVNFGFDAGRSLARLPLERVEVLHLAGGRWIDAGAGERRLLDDHLHRIPAPVFDLLEEVGLRSERPLSVIVERDGAYPAIEALLAELGSVRAALARGRARRPPVPA